MKNVPQHVPTPEYERLQQEVEALKSRPAHPPSDLPLPDNVFSLGELIKPVIERLGKVAEKTTSFSIQLKEWLAEKEPEYCEEHEDIELPVDYDRTFSESFKDRKLMVVYAHCPKCKEETAKALVNEKWKRMGVPHKVLGATFQNFDQDTESKRKALKKTQRQYTRGNGFLLLRGTFGTGKSHLASACLKKKGRGIFITEADLVAELRQTYADNSGPQEMTDKYRETPILVLDELSTDVKGTDVPQLLYRILAHRYDTGLLTVITSNETTEVAMDILGPRLTDRIKENLTIVTMEWESHRKAVKDETN